MFALAKDVNTPSKEEDKTKQDKKEEKVEIKPYKVFDQDFSLTDPDFISYYKTRMKMMGVKFRLVGRINEQGQYKISNEIRYDLIDMEKEIEENGEDYYKAIALYMKKHFYFHVKIKLIEDGKAKASLYLSEYVQDFLGREFIVSHIADFVDKNDDEFRIKVRKAFNLVDVATKKIDDFDVPNLAVIMQDSFDLDSLVGGLYDMASQIYLLRLLKALEESGEKGALVVARYRELLADSDIEINEKYRYTHYKALLDRAIDELGGYQQLQLDPKVIKPIVKDMNKTVKAIDSASMAGMLEADLPNKKSEEKKGAKASSKPKNTDKKKKEDSSAKKEPTKKKTKSAKKNDKKTKGGGGASLDFFNKTVDNIVTAILDDDLFEEEKEEKPQKEEPAKKEEVLEPKVLSEEDIEIDEFNQEDLEELGVKKAEIYIDMSVKRGVSADGTIISEVSITAETQVVLEGNLEKNPLEAPDLDDGVFLE